MNTNKKTPKLRFKGFTDDWEQRKLGDVAIITGGGTPSTNVPEYWNGDIDWYSPVEIGKNRYVSKSTRKITKLGLEKSSAKLLPIGTVLFTSRAGIGNTAILQAEGCTNQGFQSITPDSKELDTYFLYTMTPRLKRYGEVTGAGSTFVEVSGKQMEKMSLVLPSLEEQKQIGRFFRTIDDSITLHQRKLEKLKLNKSALLQKLFPQKGCTIPDVRFKGFTDAWEQRKLGDLAEIVRGASPRPISDSKWFDNNSDVGWLRISDVTAQDGRIQYLEQKISKLGQDKTRVVKTPHLLLSIAATVGKPVINYVPTGVHDGFLIFLNPKFNILYAFWWLEIFREEWNKYGQPGSQVNLNSDLVKNQVINIPNEKEQEKISSFLEALDRIITLHQRKLDCLISIKKGLLQQLFV